MNRDPIHAHTHTHTHTLRHFSNTEEKSQVFKFFQNHDNTDNLIEVEQKNS